MVRQKVVIIGSGGLAKEILSYLDHEKFQVLYAVSTEPFENEAGWHRQSVRVYPSVGKIDLGDPTVKLMMAVADPVLKGNLRSQHSGTQNEKDMYKMSDKWLTWIHPLAVVSPHARIGIGCVITPFCVVTSDAYIGDFVFMNTHAVVGHDSFVGDYSTLGPHAEVCGHCKVGSFCSFGISSYLLPGRKIGGNNTVSAGAIVRHNYPPDVGILQGDPAKPRPPKVVEVPNATPSAFVEAVTSYIKGSDYDLPG